MTNTMPERFESRFGDKFNNVKGNKKIVKTGTNIDDIIDFFQSEIDLAVAEREKEIKEKIKNFVIINNEFKVGAEEMRHSILNWCFKY